MRLRGLSYADAHRLLENWAAGEPETPQDRSPRPAIPPRSPDLT
jgi:hypothetical protein